MTETTEGVQTETRTEWRVEWWYGDGEEGGWMARLFSAERGARDDIRWLREVSDPRDVRLLSRQVTVTTTTTPWEPVPDA